MIGPTSDDAFRGIVAECVAGMAAYLPQDLRIRVIRAIEGGMSRNAAAKRFGISCASAIRWMQTYLRTGRTQANPVAAT